MIDTLTVIHLPNGPTAQFKITNVVMRKSIPVSYNSRVLHLIQLIIILYYLGTWKTNRSQTRAYFE